MDALFLELEGVIADTRTARATALAEALAAEGVAVRAEAAVEHARGRTARGAVQSLVNAESLLLDDVAVDLVVLRAERAFATRIGAGLTLMPGALPFINRAHGSTRLAIATRLPRSGVEFVLGLAGLEFAFEAVVAAEDAGDDAPAGERFRIAQGRLAARRAAGRGRRCALVDGGEAIAQARAAGLRTIVAGEVPAHEALEADGLVPTLDGLTIEGLDALLARAEEEVP